MHACSLWNDHHETPLPAPAAPPSEILQGSARSFKISCSLHDLKIRERAYIQVKYGSKYKSRLCHFYLSEAKDKKKSQTHPFFIFKKLKTRSKITCSELITSSFWVHIQYGVSPVLENEVVLSNVMLFSVNQNYLGELVMLGTHVDLIGLDNTCSRCFYYATNFENHWSKRKHMPWEYDPDT